MSKLKIHKTFSNFRRLSVLTVIIILLPAIITLSGCQPKKYALTYLAGTGGRISGEINQRIESGNDGSIVMARAYTGYRFVKWSDGLTTPQRTDLAVTKDITVTAEFEMIMFQASYNAKKGGNIKGKANQTIKYGGDAEEVTAVSDNGYNFLKWSDGLTTPERTDLDITKDITVTAEFEMIMLWASYRAGEGGNIKGKANQSIEYGGDAEKVTAVADPGYYFIKWSDDVTTPERNDLNVTMDIIVTAIFRKI